LVVNKQIIILILTFLFCFVGISCRSTTAPDTTPRETTVRVKYIRALPITDPLVSDIVSLAWSFPDESGSTDMPKVAENTFTFVADKPPPPHLAHQEVLMAAEIGSEYFS